MRGVRKLCTRYGAQKTNPEAQAWVKDFGFESTLQ
jgi:hypothetical protein